MEVGQVTTSSALALRRPEHRHPRRRITQSKNRRRFRKKPPRQPVTEATLAQRVNVAVDGKPLNDLRASFNGIDTNLRPRKYLKL